MAASSAARLSGIGVSLRIASPGCSGPRRYIPAEGPELIAAASNRIRSARVSLSVESRRQTEGLEDLGILEHRIPADALVDDREDLERVQLVSATAAPEGG